MSLAIIGMGTCVPSTEVTLLEGRLLAQFLCAQNDAHVSWLPSMYDHTGIRKRHMAIQRPHIDRAIRGDLQPVRARGDANGRGLTSEVFLPTGPGDPGPSTGDRVRLYQEHAPGMAMAASVSALKNADVDPATITHLVTVSCTGFFAPGIDAFLIDQLDLNPTVERTHIGYMGCHGALNGLRVARAFVEADASARVLLCAVELCSLHYHFGWEPQQIIANAIFADGAAAVVCMNAATTGEKQWRLRASGSCLIPDSTDAMTWRIGDYGFEMTLARSVPALIGKHLRPWLSTWLSKHGLALDDVSNWAVHPGGPSILSSVEECLDLPRTALAVPREIFSEYGNMSSPTVLFILDRMRQRKAKGPCVALGFGPGLTAEAALFE